ncbi:MAG TPA: hypothetical protein ENI27_06105 [bacterium]|nr:hypothetical protein [bacterium]
MEETVTNGFWTEAVRATGYILDDNFWNLMKGSEFEKILKAEIRKPGNVRKVWRRIKRREGLEIVKVTSITRRGWINP